MRERIIHLDIIRIVACCMIVLMHSPHPNAGNSGPIVVPLSFITESGIGLFFMVSGALLLFNHDLPLDFIKKRLKKVVLPTLFWSLFYLGVRFVQGSISLLDLIKAMPSIPFSAQGQGVLWFMYVLIGLYLLTPILSAFLRQSTQKEIQFYIIVWAITLFYPLLKDIVGVNDSTTGILYYFTGYVGYYVLGYYLRVYVHKFGILLPAIMICIPVLALVVYSVLGYESWLSSGRFGYLSIFVVMMCVGWYGLLAYLSAYLKDHCNINWDKVSRLSNCCFGVYLMHIFIMRNIIWNIDFIVYNIGGIGQVVITWILTLLISFVSTYLIAHCPFSDYIIGYKIR